MTYQFPSVHLSDEATRVDVLLASLDWDSLRSSRVTAKTRQLLDMIRSTKGSITEIETFLQHYKLNSPEGLSLMTLAEALLRIPDAGTADALIAEKINAVDWSAKSGGNGLMQAAGLGLSVAQKTLNSVAGVLARPIVRKTMEETVRRLGEQFVIGATIEKALHAAHHEEKTGYRLSFDMLGEGARTDVTAGTYFDAYAHAIEIVAQQDDRGKNLFGRHGISVKLSALHPRYNWTQADTCVPQLASRLLALCKMAAAKNITLTVDAEESDRLEMSIDIMAQVSAAPELKGWNGLGLAVQAYDKRCFTLLDDLANIARRDGRVLQVRLVKGAYWDGEIKRAQVAGWPDYPVFTRKRHTDLSYLACAQKMLAQRDVFYPMFATHNAQTVAAILDFAGSNMGGFEFQRLYGMGKALGDWLCAQKLPVTIYGPVGSYEDLLPYLVRRMLENGANTSFVAKIRDETVPADELAFDPVALLRGQKNNSSLPKPLEIYGPSRRNSQGYDLSNSLVWNDFMSRVLPASVTISEAGDLDKLFQRGAVAQKDWNLQPAERRADILRKAADLMEQETGHLIHALQSEGKKTLADAIAEIREAVDFCRYYAAEGVKLFDAQGQTLTGPTGELNILRFNGRGVFVCISPWNFPLAIFLGQITAALMAGNSVIAKPAEQTPQIGLMAIDILHRAGVPKDVVQIVVGDGDLGARLVAHRDVAGVAFTGSTDVARLINRSLAAKDGPIVPLIAETGGQNAMVVDSSALPEQVIDDVMISAFGSAGQRCSALRVLYLQQDIADPILKLLQGAMALLRVGDPRDITTDVGPVIDADAKAAILKHRTYLNGFAKFIAEAPVPPELTDSFVSPVAYEIDSLERLTGEVFGPVLHIIRYAPGDIDKVIADINKTGFGLTFGVHSRLQQKFDSLPDRIKAGNIYINRSMIGAVVGVQPFGGQGLSGTGPKAGGPHYLTQFATEQAISVNTMATGGNIDLIASIKD